MSTRVLFLVTSLACALSAVAHAGPVEVRIQPPQLRRLESELGNRPFAYAADRIEMAGALCFDPIEITNLRVDANVGDVSLTPSATEPRLDARIVLKDVEVRGVIAADGSFPCFDVEETLDPLRVENVDVSVALGMSEGPNGELVLTVLSTQATVGTVTVTGSETLSDLEEDFGALSWAMPSIIEAGIEAGIGYANARIEALRAGTAFGIPYRVVFTEAAFRPDGAMVAATLEPGLAEKAACLAPDAVAPALNAARAAPTLPATLSPESGLLVAASADLPARAFASAWWAGLLCGEASLAPPKLLQETLERLTGKASGTITVRYSVAREPRIEVSGQRVRVELDGVRLEAFDPSSTLLSADFRVVLAGRARIDPETRLVLGSIEDAEIDVSRLDSSLFDGERSREEMTRFLEVDLPEELVAKVRDLAVADAVFVDPKGRTLLELVQAEEGFRAALSPILVSNPELDAVAPDTVIGSALEHGWTETEVHLAATDDRAGTLVYSWSIDGGPWSPWSRETSFVVETPPGSHEVRAIARDRWGNVDATPATLSFVVPDARTVPGCGCRTVGSAGASAALPLAIGALAFLALRRRRAAGVAAIALASILAPAAGRADDTRVMPAPYFTVSLTAVDVLHNPPSDVTTSSATIPTGAFPLGLDAVATERHRMQARLLVPSTVVGIGRGFDVVAYLPFFERAEMRIQHFEVRTAGVNMTAEAQEQLRVAGFKSPSEGGDPVSTWRGRGFGDAGAMLRWRAWKQRDSALLVSGGLTFPTGRKDDPLLLTDFAFGDPAVGIAAEVRGERRVGRGVVGGMAGYRLRLPGTMKTRPVGGPTVTMVHDPGDVIRAGISTRTSGARMRALSASASAKVEHHLPDHNNAGITLPDQRGTALVVSASAGANNVKWFLRHRFGLPGGVSVGVERSFSTKKRLQVMQATARLDLYL